MRKHITPVWFGLAFLVLASVFIPASVDVFSTIWPANRFGVLACWLLLALVVCQRRSLAEALLIPGCEVVTDALLLSFVAAATAAQTFPEAAALGLLKVGAQAFGNTLFGTAIWSFLIASFAYVIAPSRSLVEADHPVQHRDRENASKFLLVAAGVELLYKVISTLI